MGFPQARRIVEETKGPVTYASVSALSPRVRNSPRQKIQLDADVYYSQYSSSTFTSPRRVSQDSSQHSSPRQDRFAVLFQKAAEKGQLQLVSNKGPKGANNSQEEPVPSVPMDTGNTGSQKRKPSPDRQSTSEAKTARKKESVESTSGGKPPDSKKTEVDNRKNSKVTIKRSFKF